MARLSLSVAWDEARQIIARDGGLLSAVALALIVLPETVSGLVAPSVDMSPTVVGRIISLVSALIGVAGQIAIVRLALGPSTTVAQAITHGFRRFLPVVGAIILLGVGFAIILIPLLALLIGAGVIEMPDKNGQGSPSFAVAAMLIVIGTLFVAVKFIMTVPVASAENSGPLAILKRSWKITAGHYWSLFAFELLLLGTALVLLITVQVVGGTIAQLVGGDIRSLSLSALILAIFLSAMEAAFTVFASVMLARIYAQLAGAAEVQPSVPTTGT